MHAGSMIRSLEGEELVNGLYGWRIARRNYHLTTTREIPGRVGNVIVQRAHLLGAGHVFHRVHNTGEREISSGEGFGDGAHVLADNGSPRRVCFFALEHDSPAGGQRLEDVLRGVLVDTHH